MSDDPVTAIAGAVEKTAETTGKVVDQVGTLAGYFEPFFRERAEISADNARFKRWKNGIKLHDKAQRILAKRGISVPTRYVPAKIAVPLLSFGSLEEDDELQNLWAKLLANAADASSGMEIRTTYIEMLKDLTAFDVRILAMFGKLSYSDLPQPQLPLILTHELPENAVIYTDLYSSQHPDDPHPPEPSEDVRLALSNMLRAGCIAGGTGWGGGVYFHSVQMTPVGMGLYRACMK